MWDYGNLLCIIPKIQIDGSNLFKSTYMTYKSVSSEFHASTCMFCVLQFFWVVKLMFCSIL